MQTNKLLNKVKLWLFHIRNKQNKITEDIYTRIRQWCGVYDSRNMLAVFSEIVEGKIYPSVYLHGDIEELSVLLSKYMRKSGLFRKIILDAVKLYDERP